MMNRREALGHIGVAALLGMGSAGGGGAAEGRPAPLLMRRIPSSGEMIPAVGVGTWQTFDVGDAATKAELDKVLTSFADLGGRVIDSSPMYGRSEDVVGELSAKHALRPRQFIATKVWTTGKAAGIRQMEDSMRKLRTGKTIDLMQVHNLVDVETHLDTLQGWKREGRVRYIGVTHYDAGSHAAVAAVMAKHQLDFVQINYSVGEREAEQRLLPMAQERGVAVIANRPFAGGDMFRRLRSRALPPWAAELGCTTWAQLMLKFVISHPALSCAIPGTGRVSHMVENLAAASGIMPDAAMRAKIAAAAV
jgi:diketogulonate reductase-like aldo/keto reductase